MLAWSVLLLLRCRLEIADHSRLPSHHHRLLSWREKPCLRLCRRRLQPPAGRCQCWVLDKVQWCFVLLTFDQSYVEVDEVGLHVLGCRLTYYKQTVTCVKARFSVALRPQKLKGSLGRTTQDGHLDYPLVVGLLGTGAQDSHLDYPLVVGLLGTGAQDSHLDYPLVVGLLGTGAQDSHLDYPLVVGLLGTGAQDSHLDYPLVVGLLGTGAQDSHLDYPLVVGLLGTGAQDSHLGFHTAPELWNFVPILAPILLYPYLYPQFCTHTFVCIVLYPYLYPYFCIYHQATWWQERGLPTPTAHCLWGLQGTHLPAPRTGGLSTELSSFSVSDRWVKHRTVILQCQWQVGWAQNCHPSVSVTGGLSTELSSFSVGDSELSTELSSFSVGDSGLSTELSSFSVGDRWVEHRTVIIQSQWQVGWAQNCHLLVSVTGGLSTELSSVSVSDRWVEHRTVIC